MQPRLIGHSCQKALLLPGTFNFLPVSTASVKLIPGVCPFCPDKIQQNIKIVYLFPVISDSTWLLCSHSGLSTCSSCLESLRLCSPWKEMKRNLLVVRLPGGWLMPSLTSSSYIQDSLFRFILIRHAGFDVHWPMCQHWDCSMSWVHFSSLWCAQTVTLCVATIHHQSIVKSQH